MMLTGLAECLSNFGLDVVEIAGWQTRATTDDHGRKEDMTSVDGVTCHHTGSGRGLGVTLGLATVVHGRADLEGPLAHLYLNREGTFYVVAAGRCNHAGESLKTTYTNSHRIGIEALAAGDGWSMDWPDVQMEAYAQGCKALSDHYHFPLSEVLGHKETCSPPGRKIDPSFNMTEFRHRVAHSVEMEAITMDWSDKRKLTDADAAAYGGDSQPGDDSSWSVAVRYPPAVQRLRREMHEEFDKLNAQLADMAKRLPPAPGK